MKYFSLVLLVCGVASCTSIYDKAGNGYEYRVIANGGGKKAVYGNFIQFHLRQVYKDAIRDTLIGDTRNEICRIQKIDTSVFSSVYLKAFSDAAKGDSIVIRISTDSLYNYPYAQVPEYMHSGGYMYTTIKVLNIFDDQDLADSAMRAELSVNGLRVYNKQLAEIEKKVLKDRPQIEADSKKISDQLDKSNVKYLRGKWGSFVVIHDEGTGRQVTYNDVVGFNYTGKTMDSGKVFNSNIDPKFDNPGLFEIAMRYPLRVMPGWSDAMLLLKEGAKATVYFPSSLAFGKKGFPPRIKPGENIIFDIEVKKVLTEDEALQIVTENRKRAKAAQGNQPDSALKIFH